jgi:hypothetical protein
MSYGISAMTRILYVYSAKGGIDLNNCNHARFADFTKTLKNKDTSSDVVHVEIRFVTAGRAFPYGNLRLVALTCGINVAIVRRHSGTIVRH